MLDLLILYKYKDGYSDKGDQRSQSSNIQSDQLTCDGRTDSF